MVHEMRILFGYLLLVFKHGGKSHSFFNFRKKISNDNYKLVKILFKKIYFNAILKNELV